MKMQTAKGVSDTPPEEKIIKNQVLSTLTQVFELYGFAPLETPVIERFDTLAAKSGSGEESDALKETFKLTDQGKRKLGLRFEFTTSLARYVAMNFNIKMPFKRYEFGPVFRDGPIKLGRYRQFWQCDADTIGTSSMLADAECVAILSTAFNKLDFKFEIKVNNRKILNGIMNQAGIKDQKEALISIDKLDKIGKEGVAKELKERGYKEPQIDKLFDLILGKVTLASLKKKITKNTAAIMVETIMGEGGIKVIPDWGLRELRKICNKKNILLILDEVQCGIGRSGDFFAFEKSKVKPDIVPIAKGIGGGFPIGAVLMNKKVAAGMTAGTHGSTFGGNPLAMAVGNSVMDIIANKKFLKHVKNISKYFLLNLNKIKEKYPRVIKEIRGRGLLIGIQLHTDQANFIKKLMENKLLTIRAVENVVRVLPPLNVKKNEIDQALKIIKKVCSEVK